MLLQHFYQNALDAYRGTSFDPEKRAKNAIKDYSEELESHMQQIRDAAENQDEGEGKAQRYRQGYEKHFSAWLSSRSRLVSPMIAGPSNFPTARMRKYNDWEHNKYGAFIEFRKKALAAAIRKVKPPVNELEKARKDLANYERLQVVFREANKIVRKYKTPTAEAIEKLEAIGIPKDPASLFEPDSMGRIGFAPYVLTNNGASIRRLKKRVAELEAKEQKATEEPKQFDFTGGYILLDYAYDRVKIFHDEKPAPEVIQKLKSRGFHWSRNVGCWMRKITNAAIYDAKSIVGI